MELGLEEMEEEKRNAADLEMGEAIGLGWKNRFLEFANW